MLRRLALSLCSLKAVHKILTGGSFRNCSWDWFSHPRVTLCRSSCPSKYPSFYLVTPEREADHNSCSIVIDPKGKYFDFCYYIPAKQNSSVSKVTSYGMDKRDSIFSKVKVFLFSVTNFETTNFRHPIKFLESAIRILSSICPRIFSFCHNIIFQLFCLRLSLTVRSHFI
jgi:hypothetical protein